MATERSLILISIEFSAFVSEAAANRNAKARKKIVIKPNVLQSDIEKFRVGLTIWSRFWPIGTRFPVSHLFESLRYQVSSLRAVNDYAAWRT